jgi:ribosomal protein S18 acetylase RimI-like enzyme
MLERRTPTIRPATPADIPRMAELAAKLVQQHHGFDPLRFIYPTALEQGYARYYASELADPHAVLLVAELAGAPPAVVGLSYGRLEGRDWNALLDTHGALHDLYVDEPARRTGAGRGLVAEMIRRLGALGAPRVVLHTASQNAGAQRLFEALGFRRTMVEMTREIEPAP